MNLQISQNPSKVAAFYFLIPGNTSCLSPQLLSCPCPCYENKRCHCPRRLGNVRQLLLFQKAVCVCVCVCVCVRYPSYFSQALNSRRSLTVILPFGLFRCSWSASFGRPPRAACLSSRWGLAGSSWSILLQPRLLPGPWADARVPAGLEERSGRSVPSSAFCSSQPKSRAAWRPLQPRAQMSGWDTASFPLSLLELYSFTIANKRRIQRPYFLLLVCLCSPVWEKQSGSRGNQSKSKIVFRFPWRGWDGSSVWLGAVCFLGLAFSMRHRPHRCLFFFLQMNMLMKLQEAANYPGTQSCDSDSTSHHEDILDSSLESTL